MLSACPRAALQRAAGRTSASSSAARRGKGEGSAQCRTSRPPGKSPRSTRSAGDGSCWRRRWLNQDEVEDHGTVYSDPLEAERVSIEAMREIWTKEVAEYHGEFVDFDPVIARPEPVRKPRPPSHAGGVAHGVPSAMTMVGFQVAIPARSRRNSARPSRRHVATASKSPRSHLERISKG
jgi:hypothetical protein